MFNNNGEDLTFLIGAILGVATVLIVICLLR